MRETAATPSGQQSRDAAPAASAAPTAIGPPPAYGFVEQLYERLGGLHIAGWLLLTEGPFERVAVRIAGQSELIDCETVLRSDLEQELGIPGAQRAGFRVLLPVPASAIESLDVGGTLELEILGLHGGRPAGYMQLGYHVSQPVTTYPPPEVMRRATGRDDVAFWHATGVKACNDFRRVLLPHLPLERVSRVLEWGCGSGRLTKHIIDRLPFAEVHGADIDVEAVQWAGQHLRGKFTECRTEPPLPYQDEHFDLIVALSVFSHLTLPYQRLWLQELRRVLRPGGVLLATSHGEFAARMQHRDPAERAALLATGFNADCGDPNLGHVAGPGYYRGTYQTIPWTRDNWSRVMPVIECVEAGMNNFQDIYVLRRPFG